MKNRDNIFAQRESLIEIIDFELKDKNINSILSKFDKHLEEKVIQMFNIQSNQKINI